MNKLINLKKVKFKKTKTFIFPISSQRHIISKIFKKLNILNFLTENSTNQAPNTIYNPFFQMKL